MKVFKAMSSRVRKSKFNKIEMFHTFGFSTLPIVNNPKSIELVVFRLSVIRIGSNQPIKMKRLQENELNTFLYQKIAFSTDKNENYSKSIALQTLYENSFSNDVMNCDQKDISSLQTIHQKNQIDMLENDSKTFLTFLQTIPKGTNSKNDEKSFISFDQLTKEEPFLSLFTRVYSIISFSSDKHSRLTL
jgi:hypothetical protein